MNVRSRSTGHSRRSLSNVSVTSEPSCDVIAASRNVKTSSGTSYAHAHTHSLDLEVVVRFQWVGRGVRVERFCLQNWSIA